MLFLRKIFSLKKRHFPENNFSERDDILLKYSFFYKQLTSFKQCLLKILLELLPNLCQLITCIAFLLCKICWKASSVIQWNARSVACGSTVVHVLKFWVVLIIIKKIHAIYSIATEVWADKEGKAEQQIFISSGHLWTPILPSLLPSFLETLGGWTLLSHPTRTMNHICFPHFPISNTDWHWICQKFPCFHPFSVVLGWQWLIDKVMDA